MSIDIRTLYKKAFPDKDLPEMFLMQYELYDEGYMKSVVTDQGIAFILTKKGVDIYENS